jgi:hypothetical protein
LRREHEAHAARLGELERVVGEVQQDLAHARGVADQRGRHRRVHVHLEREAARRSQRALDARDLVEQGARVERRRLERELAGLDAREVEQVVHQLQQVSARGQHGLGVLALLGLQPGAEQQLAHAQQPRHRGADVVPDVGQERALRFVLALGRAAPLLRQRQRVAPLHAVAIGARGAREDEHQHQRVAGVGPRRCATAAGSSSSSSLSGAGVHTPAALLAETSSA